jgi:polyisoprenoid-binding protein YceI
LHYSAQMNRPAPEEATVRYALDPKVSRFTVQAYASGLFSSFGHNPVIAITNFSGEAKVTPETIEPASLLIKIPAASLEVASDVSDKDRKEIERMMQQTVLESSSHPEIVFECSQFAHSVNANGQYWVNMNGDLTLHGVARGQNVSANVTINGDTLRAQGNFSLLQSDYAIQLVSVAGGTLKVKDELKFTFDVVARKQE